MRTLTEVYMKYYATREQRSKAFFLLTSALCASASVGVAVLVRVGSVLPPRAVFVTGLGFWVLLVTWIGARQKYLRIQELQELHRDSASDPMRQELLAMASAWVYQLCLIGSGTVVLIFGGIWVVARELLPR